MQIVTTLFQVKTSFQFKKHVKLQDSDDGIHSTFKQTAISQLIQRFHLGWK